MGKGRPLFPFGFGLSYTDFRISTLGLKFIELPVDGSFPLQVEVSNTGGMDGDEVVFAYVTNDTDVTVDSPMPAKSLVAFQRVHVMAGSSALVTLQLDAKRFALVDSNGVKAVHPGHYKLRVDRGHGTALEVPIQITGESLVLFKLQPWWGEVADTHNGFEKFFV